MSDITKSWSRYVRAVIGERRNNEVAELVGVTETTIGNWVNAKGFKRPGSEEVVKFARAFRQPLHEALIAAGIGNRGDYTHITMVTEPDLSVVDTAALSAELTTRLQDREGKARPRRTGATRVRQAGTIRQVKVTRAQTRPSL